MAYTRINWQDGPDGGTPLSAANLNHMDQGIADAHDRLDTFSPAKQFQVSSNVGGTGVTLAPAGNPGASTTIYRVYVNLQPGQKIVLKQIRFALTEYAFVSSARLQVRWGGALIAYTSTSKHGYEAPNVVLFENTGGSAVNQHVEFRINNIDSENQQPVPGDAGFWALLAIE